MIAAPDPREFLIVSSVPLRPKLDGLLARIPIVDRWRCTGSRAVNPARMLGSALARRVWVRAAQRYLTEE